MVFPWSWNIARVSSATDVPLWAGFLLLVLDLILHLNVLAETSACGRDGIY